MSKRSKDTRKRGGLTYRGYLHIPNVVFHNSDFIHLSNRALKLLIDVAGQYNGYNNGDLCCSMSVLRKRGWNSNDMLTKAKKELIERNWIERTRSGGLNMGPDLYAITWQRIDECGGKLDVNATTRPSRKFKSSK